VDQEARVRTSRQHLDRDLVERDDAVAEVADRHAEDEERRRRPAGDGDLDVAELVERERLARDEALRPAADRLAEALAQADGSLIIPMMGMVQSLNVSVAVGIVLFELLRQSPLTR
jgi:hypothetical protein